MPAGDGKTSKRLRIGFILARAFTLSAFAMFADMLRLASDEADRSGRRFADWQVMSSSAHLVRSSCGVNVAPTSALIEPSELDYVVVVGGLLNSDAPVDDTTRAYLQRAADSQVPLIGVCTGSFILAEAGLMEDHETCVSWLHYDTFRERFPHLKVRADRLFNLDRNRGSCAGGSSAADLAALIVRRHIGKEAEKNAIEVLQLERARAPEDTQSRQPLAFASDDPRLKAVLIVMEKNLENPLSVLELARAVGISRRQLERLFLEKAKTSPALVYRQLRLERARDLVLKTKAPLIEIAMEAGFSNASHFARLFRTTYGVSPIALRKMAREPVLQVAEAGTVPAPGA